LNLKKHCALFSAEKYFIYERMKDANAAMTLLERWPEKISNPVQSLKFFQVIFPVVSWLHSHLSFFHLIATVGHLLPYFIYILMSLLKVANLIPFMYITSITSCKLHQSLKRFSLMFPLLKMVPLLHNFFTGENQSLPEEMFNKLQVIFVLFILWRHQDTLISLPCQSLVIVIFLNLWNLFSFIHMKPDKGSRFGQSLPLSAIIAGPPPPPPPPPQPTTALYTPLFTKTPPPCVFFFYLSPPPPHSPSRRGRELATPPPPPPPILILK